MTPQIGTNIQIVVSNQSARETLKTFKKEKVFTLAERDPTQYGRTDAP